MRWFRFECLMSKTVKETMFRCTCRNRRRRCKTHEFAPLALIRTIWRERNRRAFDGIEKDVVH